MIMKIQSLFTHLQNWSSGASQLNSAAAFSRTTGPKRLQTARPPKNIRRHSWFSQTLLFDAFARWPPDSSPEQNASISVYSRGKDARDKWPKRSREEERCFHDSLNPAVDFDGLLVKDGSSHTLTHLNNANSFSLAATVKISALIKGVKTIFSHQFGDLEHAGWVCF